MTIVLLTTLSILALTALAWVAARRLSFAVCPICFGVGGTWLWMIGARYLDAAFDASMLPILLGGSVVGIAYQVEKHLPAGRSPLLWKAVFLPTGFIAAYGAAAPDWSVFAAGVVALVLWGVLFFAAPRTMQTRDGATVEKLERRMKQCC